MDKSRTGSSLTKIVEIIILIAFCLLVRLPAINHLPIDDEMFQVLAAQSWASEGTFRIADGEYPRASLFTILVGILFRIFGQSLIVARLPALLAGIIWAVVFFLWLRARAGRLAAWVAVILFSMASHSIELSQITRFYTMQGLFFWLSAVGFFAIMNRKVISKASIIIACLSFLSLLLAFHLQAVTLIGLLSLCCWALIETSRRYLPKATAKMSRNILVTGLLFIIFSLSLIVVFKNSLPPLFDLYQKTPYWNIGRDLLYYHKLFLKLYPALWPYTPIAMIVIIAIRPKVGLFCSSVFAVSFLLHSFAGYKEQRYIYYVIPFFFAIWGISFSLLSPFINKLVNFVLSRIRTDVLRFNNNNSRTLVFQWAVIVSAFCFMIASNGAFPRSVRSIMGKSYYFGLEQSNWELSKNQLEPYFENASVVLTTNWAKAIYYFGDFDFNYNKNYLVESGMNQEFSVDPRNGRCLISTFDSLSIIMQCYPGGIFIGEVSEWRFGTRIDGAAADLMEAHSQPIDLPEASGLKAFYWSKLVSTQSPECSKIPSECLPSVDSK